MPFIRKSVRFRRIFSGTRGSPMNSKLTKLLIIVAVLAGIYLLVIQPMRSFLKEVAGNIAIKDASDIITAAINDAIAQKMGQGLYDYDYFVALQKDSEGNVTAISANMSRINTLSSEILLDVVEATNNGQFDLSIPLGNLLDSNLFLGRGPDIPVKIIMNSSSHADFHNELTSAGINQSKHQIILDVKVEIDVLMPWEVLSTEVNSEILIAETIIVGKVPETYFSLQP